MNNRDGTIAVHVRVAHKISLKFMAVAIGPPISGANLPSRYSESPEGAR